jgi:ribosomal protein L3 glutamine methyltransferase
VTDNSGVAVTAGALIEQLAAEFAHANLVFGHGYDSAWDEAVALVLAVTGLPDDRSVLAQSVGAAPYRRIMDLARRRVESRTPLAYLLGRCRFAGHDFLIEPGIVVPRSPIGALIQAGFAPWLQQAPGRILDLCCGSGCLGIAAALRFADARVELVDVDPRAVHLTQRNIALHGLEARVQVVQGDLFDAVPAASYDLILSNPPYVDAADMASLPPEHRHEPPVGLAGGRDGMDLVARMLAELPRRLAPAGMFVCEVGASAPALLARFPDVPFLWPDLPDGGEGVFLLWQSEVPAAAASQS